MLALTRILLIYRTRENLKRSGVINVKTIAVAKRKRVERARKRVIKTLPPGVRERVL